MNFVSYKADPAVRFRSRPPTPDDERYTPRELVERLHREWNFTVDVASCAVAPSSSIIGRWWDVQANGLKQCWDGEVVFGNIPFTSAWDWIAKMWASRARGVLMMPANRTEQPGWQHMVEPYRDRPNTVLRTEFLAKRLSFGTPEMPEGADWGSTPQFGIVLLKWIFAER